MPGEQVLVIDDSPTILKVVELVLTKAGYEVRTAPDGEAGVEAAREARPDVILLDFVMPRMNGYQVCRALSEIDELQRVPVVLMSAKGDQVGERFVKVMGIVDYITKPFSPEAITAVVGHTVARYGRANGHGPVLVAGSYEELGLALPVPDDLTAPRSTEAVERRRAQLGRLREALAIAVSDGDPATDEAGARVLERLPDAILDRLVDEVAPAPPARDPAVVLEGEVAAVPLGEVLSLLQLQQQAGVLTVEREGVRLDIHFRAGRVDYAGARGLDDEFRIGRYLVELEAIGADDLAARIAARPPADARAGGPPSGELLGEHLVATGAVAEADLREALRRQTCERIYEVLRWRGGRFRFRRGRETAALAERTGLGLSVDQILMEGFRRVDEWHLIERAVDDFDAVFLRNEVAPQQLERARLNREELVVLELVNGKSTVKEIVRESRMSSFDVSKMLYRLLSIKLVRRRVPPVLV